MIIDYDSQCARCSVCRFSMRIYFSWVCSCLWALSCSLKSASHLSSSWSWNSSCRKSIKPGYWFWITRFILALKKLIICSFGDKSVSTYCWKSASIPLKSESSFSCISTGKSSIRSDPETIPRKIADKSRNFFVINISKFWAP